MDQETSIIEGENEMTRKILVAMLIVLGVFVVCSGLTYAEELKGAYGGSINALDSGYAITRWPPGNGTILIGDDGAVRALTTEYPTATKVVFRWHAPDGSSTDSAQKPLTLSADTWDGKTVYEADDTHTIDQIGAWGVQALFIDEEGRLQGPNPYPVVQIKAISWHSIPEVPLGTIAIVASMIGALAVFAVRKKLPTPKI